MFQHPSMTNRGRQLAGVFAILIALALPKRVECGYPDGACGHAGIMRQYCKTYEIEPLGFWLIETVAHRDVGFAYSSGEECH
ncbi:hypothetical protein BH11MYX2_BH11MYX2_14870 [soil metagenome]